ncbi:unnamed protein product, partial [Ixodes hexagonus]
TENGSFAYATGSGEALLQRSFEAPFCFTAWYHVSGVGRPQLFFHASREGSYFRSFHFSSEPLVGFWHKVVYPETLTGLVNVSISSRTSDAEGRTFVALDDVTVEPGPCPPAPMNGSCDFDWNDACGYIVGKGPDLWQLNQWTKSGTTWMPSGDVTAGHEGGFAIFTPPAGIRPKGLLSSPQLEGHTGRRCLQFYYYISKGTKNTLPYGLHVFVTGQNGSRFRIWGLSGNSLLHDVWSPAQASFNSTSSFQLNFECSVESDSHKGFYCGLDYVRLTDCAPPQGNNQDCDFEGGLCSWMNLGGTYNDNELWTIGGGTIKTTLPKPSKDHTLGTSSGSYLFFSEFEQIKGAKGQLVSEAILSADPATNCMEFRYIVAGDKATKLRVTSTSLGNDMKNAKNFDLLWEAEGGKFDTWLLGRIALSENTRVIFEAVAGSGNPPGYVALDDIEVFTNDSCETFPKTASANAAVGLLLNCNFRRQSYCNWSFKPRERSVAWRFGSGSMPETNIGPTPLPAGTTGTFIFTNRATTVKNRGALLLISPKVPRQTQPVCATFSYHIFGALSAYTKVSLVTDDTGDGRPGSLKSVPFIYHMDRSAIDRWFTVRRTLDMKSKFNEITMQIGSNEERPSEMAFGPVEFTTGACEIVTDSSGWCDFEYDTCEWMLSDPSGGWTRRSKTWDSFHSQPRSGPPDSHSFLELKKTPSTKSSTVTSPWFQGSPEPQCLKFWYRRDRLSLGKIVVELVPAGDSPSSVIWEQPPYPKRDWMLALVPIVYKKEFQVGWTRPGKT